MATRTDSPAVMSMPLAGGVKDRVSVIVPAYNYGHFLADCLDSVLGQGIADLELIVVDDGSTDDTASVVARFPRVIYVQQRNQGLSAARNSGLRASTGEYLLFLDADDLLAPHSLAPRLNYLKGHDEARLSVCRNSVFSEMDKDARVRAHASWYLAPDELATRLMYFNIAPPHAYLLHREVAHTVGWFDTGLRACEDYDYWLRALGHGYAPLYSPAGRVYYRKHRVSMSADHRNQLHHDVLLHGRVLEAVLSGRTLHATDTLGALLAAYAGAFTTLARLADAGHEDYALLLTTLSARAGTVPAQAPTQRPGNTVLRDYHLLLLLERGAASAVRDARAASCLEVVFTTLGALGLDTERKRTSCYWHAAGHLLATRGAAYIDRYRVARMIVRHLLGRGAS